MNGIPKKETVDLLKKQYPKGACVELVSMNDPYTDLKPGDTGVVECVDDIGSIHVKWNNGSTLAIVYGEDKCRKV